MIDDDAVQAAALAKKLSETIPSSELMCASSEESIHDTVENKFYNLAILDIRMDNSISTAFRSPRESSR